MKATAVIAIAVLLALSSLGNPVAAQSPSGDVGIESVGYSGDGWISYWPNETTLWLSASHEFTVSVSSTSGFDGEICVMSSLVQSDERTTVACDQLSVPEQTTTSVGIGADGWPGNLTGTQEVGVEVRNHNGSVILSRSAMPITVITKGGDLDDDELANLKEMEVGTLPKTADTDKDGLLDGPEVDVHQTDPTNPDSDGDGLGDSAEINDHHTNPRDADTDNDGLSDNEEINTYDTNPTKVDTDGDGLEDGLEIRLSKTDPTKPDTDEDGLLDGQELNSYDTNPSNPDTDGDGLTDGAEVNKYETNPTKVDTNGNGVNDYKEVNSSRLLPTDLDSLTFIGLGGVALLMVGWMVRSRWLGRQSPPWQSAGLARVRNRLTNRPKLRGRLGGDTDSEPDSGGVPSEHLSNEEQIVRLLNQNDGRMRQSDIVQETGWSKGKVSRVLSEMEDNEKVTKIRVGRRNVVSLPESRPDASSVG